MPAPLPAITWPLKQKCVYWPPVPVTGDATETVAYGTPIEIKCRWDNNVTEIITKDNKPVISKTTVMVDRQLSLEGVVWFGLLSEVTNVIDPFANGDADNLANRILHTARTPDPDCKRCLYRVYL